MNKITNTIFDSDDNFENNKKSISDKLEFSSDYEIYSNIFDSEINSNNKNNNKYKMENQLIISFANEQEKLIKKFSSRLWKSIISKIILKNKLKYFKEFSFLTIYKNNILKINRYNKLFLILKKLNDRRFSYFFKISYNLKINKINENKNRKLSKLAPPPLKKKSILTPPNILNKKRISELQPPSFGKKNKLSVLLPPPIINKPKTKSFNNSNLLPPGFKSKLEKPNFLKPPNFKLKKNNNNKIDKDDPIPKEPEKLKKIFIERLQGKFLKESFWDKYKKELSEKNILIKIDFELLEIEFKNIIKQKETKKPDSDVPKLKRFLLDSKKENMIEIALNHLKIDIDSLTVILNKYQLNEINLDNLEILIKIIPSKEEEKVLLENKKEYDKLQKNDKFLLNLMSINRYKEKLICMVAMKKFEEEFNKYDIQLNSLYELLLFIKNDFNFKIFLKTILRIINFINYGSKHEESAGIILTYYRNLKNIYSIKTNVSLFEFGIKFIYESNDKLLGFIDYYEEIKSNKYNRKSFDNYLKIFEDYQHVVIQEEKINKDLFNSLSSDNINQINEFLDKSKIFINDSKNKINLYKDKLSNVDNIFKEIIINYGIKKKYEIEEFLLIFFNIIYDINLNFHRYKNKLEELSKQNKSFSVKPKNNVKSKIVKDLKINLKKNIKKQKNKDKDISNKKIDIPKHKKNKSSQLKIDNKGFLDFD